MKLKALLSVVFVAVLVSTPLNLAADKADEHRTKGRAEFNEGLFVDAVTEFREGLRLTPDSVEIRIWLGLGLCNLGAADYAQGNLEHAIAEYREALQLEPDEAYWHQALAKVLEKNGDRQGAAEEYREASDLSPDDSGLRSAYQSITQAKTVEAREDAPAKEPKVEAKPFIVGGDVTAPVEEKAPSPPYSEKARKAKYQGALVLSLVVNQKGKVSDAQVAKPLGLGLDQKALETVRKWKFKPATHNGVPVPVRVLLEVTFKLF